MNGSRSAASGNGDGVPSADSSLPESPSGTYFKDLVELAPDAILVVDQRGTIELVNRQAERLFGYERTELLGQPLDILVPDRARGVHPGHRTGYFGDPRTRPMGAGLDLTARRKDGSEVAVDISLSPLHTERGTVVSAVVRDITERRRAEGALQDAYDRLSASVAELERHDRDMTLVNEMGDLLQSCLTAHEAYQVASGYARRLFAGDSGVIYTNDGAAGPLDVAAVWGDVGPQGGTTLEQDDCWALRRARAYVVGARDDGPRCRHLGGQTEHASICVPMMAQGEAVGMLHVLVGPVDDGSRPSVLDSKRRLALTVAEQLSMALANLSLRESLRFQSMSDPLTGLFNRRYMEEQLQREILRARREKLPVAIVAVDVDHLKVVNDTLGHSAGDALLRAVARSLDAGVREPDIVCRFGGDEFIIALPGSPVDVAYGRAEQLRVAAQQAGPAFDSVPALTLSLGVAVFPDHGETAEDVLHAADMALYGAKHGGRDSVAAAAPPATEGGRTARPPA